MFNTYGHTVNDREYYKAFVCVCVCVGRVYNQAALIHPCHWYTTLHSFTSNEACCWWCDRSRDVFVCMYLCYIRCTHTYRLSHTDCCLLFKSMSEPSNKCVRMWHEPRTDHTPKWKRRIKMLKTSHISHVYCHITFTTYIHVLVISLYVIVFRVRRPCVKITNEKKSAKTNEERERENPKILGFRYGLHTHTCPPQVPNTKKIWTDQIETRQYTDVCKCKCTYSISLALFLLLLFRFRSQYIP